MKYATFFLVSFLVTPLTMAQTNTPNPGLDVEETSRSIIIQESAVSPTSTDEVIVYSERVITYSDGSSSHELVSSGGGGYRKLGTGLLREDKDGLKPSSFVPMVSASGAISFPDAPLSITFSPNANRETVVETHKADRPFPARSAVAALAYVDAQNQHVVFANVTDSQPLAIEGGVVYEDAFDTVMADILYKVHPWGLEQDVVILSELPHPSTLKLDPSLTYLSVLTELVGLDAQPQCFSRNDGRGADVADSSPLQVYKQVKDQRVLLHDFQRGVAYDDESALSFGSLPPTGEMIPVRHRVIQLQGRWFLSEEAPVSAILKATPDIFTRKIDAKAFSSAPKIRPVDVVKTEEETTRPVENISHYTPRNKPYFVMDYLDYSGTKSNDITFASGETYFISSDLIMNGSLLTIHPGAIVKYATNATIKLINNARIKSYSHLMNPAIFTTAHDTNFGQAISGYTGNPASNLFKAAFILAGTTNVRIEGIRIRYATTGIKVETSGHMLIHNRIEKGWQGVEVYSTSPGGIIEVRNTLFQDLTRGVTAGSLTSNLNFYVLNNTLDNITEYGVGTNAPVSLFSIQCTLFASVTNQLIKNNPTNGYSASGNGIYNSPTGGIGTVKVVTNNPFKTGTYGSHYLDQSTILVNGGYIFPAYWQLNRYSTATNHQEDSGTVDIGFHYPSTNDVDGDGLLDFREGAYGTSTSLADTDGDGLTDGAEVNTHGTNPLLADTDGDGLSDGSEINTHNTNPLSADTDGDGLPDGWEVTNGLDPRSGLNNLIGWWKLDESSGTTANDSSTNLNHGTVQNSSYAWWTNGMVNNAIKLNGTNSYIQLSDSSTLRPSHVSVSAWIRPDKTYSNGYAIFFSKEQPGYAGGYNVRYFNGQLDSTICSYGQYHSASMTTTLQAGVWYHITSTYDGSKHRLFVNGQKIVDTSRSVTLYHTTVAPRIGATPDWTPINHFNGIIDDVRIFNTGLSTNAVTSLLDAFNDLDNDGLTNLQEYQNDTNPNNADTDGDGMPDGWEVTHGLNPISGVHATQLGWWKFDDASGTNAVNSASTNYNGQLVNMATSVWTTGKLGGAITFDGVNDYVRVLQTPVMITGQQFTASAWVKLDGTHGQDYPTIIADFIFCSGNYKGYWVGWDSFSDGVGGFLADCAGGSSYPIYGGIITGVWTHITLTHSGTSTRVYKNGKEVVSTSGPFAPALQSELRIGWSHDPMNTYNWKGQLDDVRLYTTALSSNQIANLHDAFNDPDGDGLNNLEEYQNGTNPNSYDSDGDLLSDGAEIKRYLTSPTNWQTAGDGIIDWYKKLMGDSLPGVAYQIIDYTAISGCGRLTVTNTTSTNTYEFFYTDNLFVPWLLAETGITGSTTITYWYDCGGVEREPVPPLRFYTMGLADDFDGDGLGSAYETFMLGTSPDMADSNGNMINDDAEDFDGDGLTNAQEYFYRTNPWLADTDSDGMSDGEEVSLGFEPLVANNPAVITIFYPPNGKTIP